MKFKLMLCSVKRPAGCAALTALLRLQDDPGAAPAAGLGDEVHGRGGAILCGPQFSHYHL